MKVYFISGLAADKRIFTHIELPPGFEMVYLDWIKPIRGESLESYALRLAKQINRDENFGLIGLSLGGMIATEIAKKYPPVTTILLSSISTSTHIPPHFRLAYALRLHKIMPMKLIKSLSIIKRLFTAEKSGDKEIIKQVIRDSDPDFIRWAMGAILEWKNIDAPNPLCQIHGSKDEILPLKYTNPTHTIINGTHMMVLTKAEEINLLLRELLTNSARPENS